MNAAISNFRKVSLLQIILKMLNIFKEYLLVKCSFVPKVTFCENIFIQNFRLKFPRLSPLYGFMIRSRHHVDKRIKMEIEGHIK